MNPTPFRSVGKGTRLQLLLNGGKQDEKVKKADLIGSNGQEKPEITPRPMIVKGATYQIDTPVGTAFVTINTDEGNQPLELFINVFTQHTV